MCQAYTAEEMRKNGFGRRRLVSARFTLIAFSAFTILIVDSDHQRTASVSKRNGLRTRSASQMRSPPGA